MRFIYRKESPPPETVDEPISDGEAKPLFTDEGIKSNANAIPVPLPEKEFMGGVKSDEFVKPVRCVVFCYSEIIYSQKSFRMRRLLIVRALSKHIAQKSIPKRR